MNTPDDLSQQRAAAGSRESADERAYAAMFQALDAMSAPRPDTATRSAVLRRVAEARTRQRRERRLAQILVAGLLAMLAVYGGLASLRALRLLGDAGALIAFSALSVVVAGSLAAWFSRRVASP